MNRRVRDENPSLKILARAWTVPFSGTISPHWELFAPFSCAPYSVELSFILVRVREGSCAQAQLPYFLPFLTESQEAVLHFGRDYKAFPTRIPQHRPHRLTRHLLSGGSRRLSRLSPPRNVYRTSPRLLTRV